LKKATPSWARRTLKDLHGLPTLNDKGGKVGPVLTGSALIPKSKSSPPSSIPTHRLKPFPPLAVEDKRRRAVSRPPGIRSPKTSVELLDTEQTPHVSNAKTSSC